MALTTRARSDLYHSIAQSPFLPPEVNQHTMEHPENIDQETICKSQTLGQAVLAGDTQKALVALRDGVSPNTRTNPHPDYMLHFAAEKGDYLLAAELIARNADIEARSFLRNDHPTPLHTACIHGKAPVVMLLLWHKANVSAPYGSRRCRPLELAIEFAKEQSPDICRALVRSEASVHNPNYLSSLVPVACKSGKREIVKILLDANANPNEYVNEKNKIVNIASLADAVFFPDIMQLLLERRAQVSTPTQLTHGSPSDQVLHHAAYYGLPQSVQLLLDANADPAATNSSNQIPANVAKRRFHTEWIDHLKSGKNPPILDGLRKTIHLLEPWSPGVQQSVATDFGPPPAYSADEKI